MVSWWLTEAVPIPVTSLLPIPMMPLLGILPEGSVAANYGHPLIFLFLGGFFIAGALSRWGLHRRIAFEIVRLVGTRPTNLVAGAMLATAFLSMWVSNTATTIMMYAVGLSLIDTVTPALPDDRSRRNFTVGLLLGIAFGSSIGGLATLIGTPPNVLLAGFLSSGYGITIDFNRWLRIGLPLAAILLPLSWLWLTRLAFPLKDASAAGVGLRIRNELSSLGPLRPAEAVVLVVFTATATAWVARPQLAAWLGVPLSDTAIALIAAILLFVLPSSIDAGKPLLDWGVARHIAWDVLLLFGGGLALASAFEATQLATALGEAVAGLSALPSWAILALMTALVMGLGELTSNTASAATFLPIAGAVAVGLGASPLLFAIPIAIAASANFAMPISTPPNAIVFAHETLRMRDMVKAGVVLDLLAFVLIMLLMPLVIGIFIAS